MSDQTLVSKLKVRRDLIEEKISAAAAKSGRTAADVTLVAVSKTVDRSTVDAAYEAGFRVFGENRVQDALRKYENPLPTDATVAMIGQLQSNKASPAVRLFDRIESLDRVSLIETLGRNASLRDEPLPVLLQVNIAEEPQKAGCSRFEAAALVQEIAKSPYLRLQGFMTIAPLVAEPEEVRHAFRKLRQLQEELRGCFPNLELSTLSMGMTNDYRIAIEEGSTEVRIGRAIFE